MYKINELKYIILKITKITINLSIQIKVYLILYNIFYCLFNIAAVNMLD